MADKRQPQGRSQGKDNKTSRPVTGQHSNTTVGEITDAEDATGSDSDSQSLHSNEATYGSDDDDTALENASVSHTDDMSQTVPDDDPEIMQRYKREIAEILTNWANESGEAERLGELMEDTLSWIANTVVVSYTNPGLVAQSQHVFMAMLTTHSTMAISCKEAHPHRPGVRFRACGRSLLSRGRPETRQSWTFSRWATSFDSFETISQLTMRKCIVF